MPPPPTFLTKRVDVSARTSVREEGNSLVIVNPRSTWIAYWKQQLEKEKRITLHPRRSQAMLFQQPSIKASFA